ncbi:MAG: ABC transporter permease [Thermoanaerobacteraceae bacterium]|nr:ABC transporter permease [Thermoanaerobacteraceae bacterium]
MELIINGIIQGFKLLFSFDSEVLSIIMLTIRVSGTATLIALFIGIPLGVFLAERVSATINAGYITGMIILVSLINFGMGLPPTVVGLLVSLLLWRSGPLGYLRIMYTPLAMIIAQTLLALPIITGLTMAGIQQIAKKYKWQIMALGASRVQYLWLIVREARYSIMAAVMAGFGGAISEVGASMMVGGNIKGYTRVLTTAIVMENSKGNFSLALALGIILLMITYLIVLLLTYYQQRRTGR